MRLGDASIVVRRTSGARTQDTALVSLLRSYPQAIKSGLGKVAGTAEPCLSLGGSRSLIPGCRGGKQYSWTEKKAQQPSIHGDGHSRWGGLRFSRRGPGGKPP